MNSYFLKCGFKLIPYIFEFKPNINLSRDDFFYVKQTLHKLESDRLTHRLGENYKKESLRLNQMFLFNIIYDTQKNLPVFITGSQAIGRDSVRVFSRYFVFPEYRTHSDKGGGLLNKIDDFEVLQKDMILLRKRYSFIFWSRDKGGLFFKRLAKSRLDIFSDWQLYPDSVELIYRKNYQTIFYLNLSQRSVDEFVKADLLAK